MKFWATRANLVNIMAATLVGSDESVHWIWTEIFLWTLSAYIYQIRYLLPIFFELGRGLFVLFIRVRVPST